ncbi:MAG: hypothetical protein ACRELB_25315 [Polyangiaceae bacterium]
MALPTDIASIASVSAEKNPVLRNLLITQRYHDLSVALRGAIGGPDVNWSTFATWASKTAGQSIRNEEVPPLVREVVGDAEGEVMPHFDGIETVIGAILPTTGFHVSFLLAPIRETLGTVSTSIAEGNLEVFEELAPLFVRFVEAVQGAPQGSAQFDAFLRTLRPGPAAEDGQELLSRAFTAYRQAILETDPVAKARLMLLGNCLIGLHEQTRLQPQIKEAMDAPIDDVLRRHLHESLGTGAGKGVFKKLVDAVEKPFLALTDVAQDLWERVATRYLMSLALPGGAKLPLGRNIPKDAAAPAYLPPPLQNLTAPEELVTIVRTYDRARGSSDVGSASVDWRLLEDRMNFIVNLFRSRQQDPELLAQPFSDEQRGLIEGGAVPDGPL